MGDLNDDPVDASVTKYLGAKGTKDKVNPMELYNTTYQLYKKGIGSLAYQDMWNLFDQIIISHEFLGKDYNTLKFWKTEIFNKEFLKQQDGKYKGYPLRTHSGGVWTNGYSDHFPSLMWVVKYNSSTENGTAIKAKTENKTEAEAEVKNNHEEKIKQHEELHKANK